ncbi:MAG: hypothetical protein CBC42_06515 [Betaproteobacteria bacterium TMED82]|nr:MAG: hypothetical protein CBC42_06515 [Betaproteobacteria bacterium TMED82]|tara:strand:+ start:4757 stop:5980 length:1224 start_codon:yes stop_codon:yes gene_type:complete
MSIWSSFLEAFYCLGHNFFRTALTVLGVVIGVMAVIVMLAVGKGVQYQVNESIASIGSNLLVVFPSLQTSSRIRVPNSGSVTLTVADGEAIKQLPSVSRVAPVISRSFQILYQDVNWNARVSGITPDYSFVREWNLLAGDYISEQDLKSRNRVAMIGTTVAKELFGDARITGKVIRISNVPFLVIGVMEEKGSSITGRDQDNAIFIPFTTARKFLIKSVFPDSVSYLILKMNGEISLETTEYDVEQLLRQRHRLRGDDKNDFTVSNLEEISSTAESATNALTILLASIAGVSLIVGGIGIMNIMLVTVTERTREIGIRLAVGARQRDIMFQFLLESSIVCMVGGLLGIIFGVLCSWGISSMTQITVEVTISSIALAFFISVGVGIFFGWYPARRASMMEPVDALRTE